MPANRCPICARPVLGQEAKDERPCSVPGGQRCYELGFERVSLLLERAKTGFRSVAARVDQALEERGQ